MFGESPGVILSVKAKHVMCCSCWNDPDALLLDLSFTSGTW